MLTTSRPTAPALSPAPARATLWAVIDCGLQTWWWEARPRRVREVRLGFELIDDTLSNGDRRALQQRYAFSFWPTANLKRAAESLLDRALTREEREDGMALLQAMLGRSCWIDLLVRGAYRGVAGLRALPCDFPPHRAPLFVSLEAGRFDPAAFHRLPDKLKDRVLASPTYQALCEGEIDLEQMWPAQHVRAPTMSEVLGGDDIPW